MKKQKLNLSAVLVMLFVFLFFAGSVFASSLNDLQNQLSGKEINRHNFQVPPPKPAQFQSGTIENNINQYNFTNAFQGTIKAVPFLNVRAVPSKSGRIIGKLQNNTKINLLGTYGSWYIINYYGKKAYIWAGNVILSRPKFPLTNHNNEPLKPNEEKANNGRIKDDPAVNENAVTSENKITQNITKTQTAEISLTTVAGIISAIKEKFNVSMPAENAAVKWTVEILKNIYELFTKVPKAFYAQLKQIKMVSEATANKVCGMSAGGYVMSNDPSTIYLSTACVGDVQGTLVHEMTHSFHFANPSIIEKWQQQFWTSGRNGYSGSYDKPASSSVTNYGNSNPMEDLAESVRAYYQGQNNWRDYETNKTVKATEAAKERFEFIKNNIMNGQTF